MIDGWWKEEQGEEGIIISCFFFYEREMIEYMKRDLILNLIHSGVQSSMSNWKYYGSVTEYYRLSISFIWPCTQEINFYINTHISTHTHIYINSTVSVSHRKLLLNSYYFGYAQDVSNVLNTNYFAPSSASSSFQFHDEGYIP